MSFQIIKDDIINVKTDAMVHVSSATLQTDGDSIFNENIIKKSQEVDKEIKNHVAGEGVIREGYNLFPKYIIHTVIPIWAGGEFDEEELLYSSYKNSLIVGLDNKMNSIAFSLSSFEVYGYPKNLILRVAVAAIKDFLLKNEMKVYLVVDSDESILISDKIFDEIKTYIDHNYIDEESIILNSYNLQDRLYNEISSKTYVDKTDFRKRRLIDVISDKEETFSEMLIRLIDQKGISDVKAYKRANIDRRLFSKIKSDKEYKPSKVTAIAFAISLNLNLDETYDLLQRAGYALSPSSKFDIIIGFFIENENYNIYEINEALFSFGQNILGS